MLASVSFAEAADLMDPQLPADAPVGVLQRSRPGYDPIGIRLGDVMFYPAIIATATYDSNIFFTRFNKESDFVFHVGPELQFVSAPGRFRWSLKALAEGVLFAKNSDQDHVNAGAEFNAVYEAARDLIFSSKTTYKLDHQAPSDVSFLPIGVKPELFGVQTFSQEAAVSKSFGLIGLSFGGGYQRQEYDSFAPLGLDLNRNLDGDAYYVSSRLSYAVSPATKLFVEGRYLWHTYDTGVLDSKGYSLVGGVDFEMTRLLRGTIFGGYEHRDYNNIALGSVNGFTYGAKLFWYPTELLTVSLTGQGGINDSGYLLASVTRSEDIQVQADYELRRNIILSAVAGYRWDNFVGTVRHDETWRLGLGLTYLLNRWSAVTLQYRYKNRDSTDPNFKADQHQVGIGTRIQF